MQTQGKVQRSTIKVVTLGILLGITVALIYFRIEIPFVNISLNFIPLALTGMLFGPAAGALVGFLGNELSALLRGFAFNPLWSLVPAGAGLIYGLFLYNKEATRRRIMVAQALISLILHLGLNTLLLYIFYNKGAFGSLPLRVVKNVLLFPLEVFIIYYIAQYRTVFQRQIQ